jgi:TRAP transporter 4TM/12TM fusion protein
LTPSPIINSFLRWASSVSHWALLPTSFFLFVLFGALLDKAGAGNYFIKVAFLLMGHMRGGPAKTAVVASGMTGLISGSSIANVVTTSTFSISMMKRVGFSPEKAGAVEVASSVNAQIMPPVMRAAAFLMVEYVGISYFDVVKHAFLPAIIAYPPVVYIVHLEALKMNMQGLPRSGTRKPPKWRWCHLASLFPPSQYWLGEFTGSRSAEPSLKEHIVSVGAMILGNFVVIGFGIFFALDLIAAVMEPKLLPCVIGALIIALYVWLVSICSRYPDLVLDGLNAPITSLPELGPTIMPRLHFLLSVGVLIWCLTIERPSPALSALRAAALMILILLTQRTLFSLFRRQNLYRRLSPRLR